MNSRITFAICDSSVRPRFYFAQSLRYLFIPVRPIKIFLKKFTKIPILT
ncbi:hypothetical protein D1AOALGA4SA_10541 [Olavius algarvensis Delta 1 endosymbiont]|nr:hypothetical protein D1AOALGA4SA_10541 [Olavius algarvensis Delta 1 endosymbiont]